MPCNPVCDPCACPPGFVPYPQPWNPVIAPDTPEVAVSSIVINTATYFVAGKVVWFNLWASFTLALVAPAVSGPAYMTFSLPHAPKTPTSFGGSCSINAGPGFVAGAWFLNTTSPIQVRVGANNPNVWNPGNFRTIIGNGFYEKL